MLSSSRRGVAALRSLRFASLPTTASQTLRLIRPQPFTQNNLRSVLTANSFSTKSRHFQQNALAEEDPSEGGSSEFTTFDQLSQGGVISPVVIDTITQKMGIHTMTEVQRMTLNQCLDGQDVIAQARTGTGKTIAFLLPIIQRILRAQPNLEQKQYGRSRASVDIKGLIISPTRELAEQIAVEARKLTQNTGIRVQTAVGGTQKSYHLRSMMNEGCHLLIGTPGRVNDILEDPQSGVRLDNIQTFVLDEADRLLDIGFAPAIEQIQSYMPKRDVVPRQTLMFSATVAKSVVALVRQTMRPNFKFIRTVDPDEAPTHEKIPQKVVFLKGLQNQTPTILEIVMNAIEAHRQDPVNNMPFKAIIYFSSTNEVDMAFKVFENMQSPGIAGTAGRFGRHPLAPTQLFRMNGKLDQRIRTKESQGFRNSETAILFSSDVTARGMDFPNVSHVIQVGLPRSADDYVHRIGRTGRAGKSGEGWLLLNEDEHRAYKKRMLHPGLKLDEVELSTASLDMTKPAQIASNVAKMLQIVETGVKNVPFNIKRAVYQSLLGVLPQQFPDRQRQEQIDMMNDLARYGWGMQTPPSISRLLVKKLGYERCSGIEFESDFDRDDRGDRRGRDQSRGGMSGRGRGRGRDSFDDKDPFGLGQSGKGVFGGEEDQGAERGGFGRSSSFGSDRRSDRGSFGDRDNDRGFSGRRSFGGDRGGDSRRGGSGSFSRGGRSGGFGGRSGGRRSAFDE